MPQKQSAPAPAPEITAAIEQINARNARIRTFLCTDVSIHFSQRARVRISGSMAMKKDRNFRMTIRSIMGQEMDIGSNDTHFWFWSKRMDPPRLHYARHEHLGKSSLKTPLNPGWLMGSLNLGTVDATGAQLIRYKSFYGVMTNKTGANGERVTVLSLISPAKRAVVGHYLYGADDKMIASTEVKSHHTLGEHIVPKEMLIVWHQEGVVLEWQLRNPKINVGIDPGNWVMPAMRNPINMGEK